MLKRLASPSAGVSASQDAASWYGASRCDGHVIRTWYSDLEWCLWMPGISISEKGVNKASNNDPGGQICKTSLTCWMATCAVNSHYLGFVCPFADDEKSWIICFRYHILTASVLLGVQDLDLIPNGSNTPVSLALLVMQSERHRLSRQIGYLIVDSTWWIVQISDSRYR